MKRSGQRGGVPGRGLRSKLLAASAAFAFAALAGGAVAAGATASGRAPSFTVTTIDGKTFTLGAQRGKVIVFDFLQAGCSSCAEQVPVLDRSAARFASRGVRVLVVDLSGGSAHALRSYYRGKLAASERLLVAPDTGLKVAQRYRVTATGMTYVVGRDGSVRWQGLWLGKEKVLLRAIAQAAA